MWTCNNKENHTIEDVLANRGFDLQELKKDTNTYKVTNLEKAAIFLKENLHRFIYVVADYDCDGIMSALNLDLILKQLNANYQIRFPRRMSEGYGISLKIIKEIPANSLVITIDNGITAVDAIKAAKQKNCKVLVLDHHIMRDDKVIPNADVIVDPHVFSDEGEFVHYCGAGLAYMLAKEFDFPQELYWKTKVYAALATVADVVPLIKNNRVIVKDGLLLINKKAADLPVLYDLIRAMRLPIQADYKPFADSQDGKMKYFCSRFTELNIGFQIAPCVNAMGRMYDNGAEEVFRIFSGRTKDIQAGIRKMIETNELRKTKQSAQFEELEKNTIVCDTDRVIVAYAPGLAEGIVGLNAATFVEKYNRPAIVVTDAATEGVLKGSARSTPDINIKEVLDKISAYMLGYGGHAGAAGLQIEKKRLEELRKVLNQACPKSKVTQNRTYDLEIPEKNIAKTYVDVLKYAPYGEGFPAPIIKIPISSLSRPYRLIKDIGISFSSMRTSFCSFDTTLRDRYLENPIKENITFYGTIEYSTFNQATQVRILDFAKKD